MCCFLYLRHFIAGNSASEVETVWPFGQPIARWDIPILRWAAPVYSGAGRAGNIAAEEPTPVLTLASQSLDLFLNLVSFHYPVCTAASFLVTAT